MIAVRVSERWRGHILPLALKKKSGYSSNCSFPCNLILNNKLVNTLVLYCVLWFSFDELMAATNNKSSVMKLGLGGLGQVFFGKIRHTLMAVKFFNTKQN